MFTSVYPRWRGEHYYAKEKTLGEDGLSPLARGTLNCDVASFVQNRFIPAGAGNTDTVTFPMLYRAVYPRWRGEHIKCQPFECPDHGLSPLARGTLN